MSFDELPLGTNEARPDVVETSVEQSPSVADAPPALRTRSRRVKSAGTDAASTTDPDEISVPKSSTTRRTTRKKSPSPEAPSTTEPAMSDRAVDANSQELVSIDSNETGTTKKVSRSRKPRAKSTAAEESPVSDNSTESSGPSVQGVLPEAISTATPEPTPRRSSTRRKKSPVKQEETIAVLAADESVELLNASPAETVPQDTPVEVAAPVRASRSRSGSARSRKKKVIEPTVDEVVTEEVDNISLALDSSAIADTETTLGEVESDADSTVPDATGVRKKRRRTRRSRKSASGEAVAQVPSKSTTTSAEPFTESEVTAPIARQPEPEPLPYIDRSIGAHLIERGGVPVIHINGYPYPPTLFFGGFEDDVSREHVLAQVKRASESGVHLLSTIIELYCPLSEDAQSLDKIDNQLRVLLDADPNAYVMPRIVFVPARGWRREYPTDISQYADGSAGDPSITSVRFWQECERALHALVTHIRGQLWGSRVFGYHLERGEWFQPAALGYDRSIANRDAFRDWLRERYNHNLVALRSSWYDADVQFHTAEIPAAPAKPVPGRMFMETRRDRRTIDFNEFTSESTAHRLCALARAVKRASQYSALVSICYGYTTEFTHSYSGHLALDIVLNDPCVDLICGPPSYKDRKPGGAASIPGLHDSVRLHGKLWLSEDDTKTWLATSVQAPDDFNPRLADKGQTEQAHLRAIGRALATGTSIGWMDLWGEGWLNDTEIWARISRFTTLAQSAPAPAHLHPRYDVIALVDEKSLLHLQPDEDIFAQLTIGMRDTLSRTGARIGVFLQNDIVHSEFPLDAKLYLFLNPYRLTVEQRNAVHEKLHSGNRTLVWVYGPGLCERIPSSGIVDDAAGGSVGIVLRRQPYDSEVGSKILETNHPITRRMSGKDYGTRRRLNPSLFADDAAATVLAEYAQSGLPSIVVKEMHGWKSIFVGDPMLTPELLRGICMFAGVPLYTDQEDIVNVGNGWISLHASRDGHRTVRLPEPSGLYDLLENRMVINPSEKQRDHRFFMRAGATRLFYMGTLGQIQSLGMPTALPVVHATELDSDELPPPDFDFPEPDPILPEPEPYLPAPQNDDLETLRAVLTMDIPAMDDDDFMEAYADDEDDLPLTPVTEEQRAASALTLDELLRAGDTQEARRRRRRGGRGRGRRPELDDGGLPPPPGMS